MDMRKRALLMFLVILVATVAVTQSVIGDKENQTVEISQVITETELFYRVKVTEGVEGIDIVHAQIRNPDGILLWDSGFYFPEGKTEFVFAIPRDVVIEHQGTRARLEVKVTDGQEPRPVFSKWVTPEWYVWEPPYWPVYEGLECVYEEYYGGVGGVLVPVDKFGLMAPYIGLASTVIVAVFAATFYTKRVKCKKDR